ncbi:MAG TPA: hypothetical protein VLV89_10180 [Candidatus Acidoferrum sp.]|nr:hypothetical protein [Candidatus Acidoferrum sp.]
MRFLARLAPIFILFAFAAGSAQAQEITPANLPADITLVVFSHSNAQIRAAAPANPIAQSWYGPESTQVRRLLMQYLVSKMDPKPNGETYKLTPENADRLASLLENSLVFGTSNSPGLMFAATPPSGGQKEDAYSKMGAFFILDTTGKESQFNLLWSALLAALPKEIAHTKYNFAGISVDKFAGPNETTFSAQIGARFVWSTQQKLTEDLIARLSSGAASSNSLADNPDFQHCQARPASGSVFDAFFRIPDLSKIPIPPVQQFDVTASIQALHLDSIHAMCGNVSMGPVGGMGRWTILGDTSQDSPLSWAGSNRTKFDTFALAPPNATSVSIGTFDLQAFYKSLKNAVAAAMPGRQQASADMMEGMAAMQLGMPIPDLLGLFRGEFASIKIGSQTSPTQQVFALTIANPEQILTLIHKFAPTAISSELQENGVTYLTVAATIPPAITTVPHSPYTYVALTPRFMLISPDKQILRDAVERSGAPQGAAIGASIADNADVQKLRAMFPTEVMGFTITDYKSSEFQKMMTDTFESLGAQDKTKITPEEVQLIDSLKKIQWVALMGNLRWGVGAWWKDANGIHFENRMQ